MLKRNCEERSAPSRTLTLIRNRWRYVVGLLSVRDVHVRSELIVELRLQRFDGLDHVFDLAVDRDSYHSLIIIELKTSSDLYADSIPVIG